MKFLVGHGVFPTEWNFQHAGIPHQEVLWIQDLHHPSLPLDSANPCFRVGKSPLRKSLQNQVRLWWILDKCYRESGIQDIIFHRKKNGLLYFWENSLPIPVFSPDFIKCSFGPKKKSLQVGLQKAVDTSVDTYLAAHVDWVIGLPKHFPYDSGWVGPYNPDHLTAQAFQLRLQRDRGGFERLTKDDDDDEDPTWDWLSQESYIYTPQRSTKKVWIYLYVSTFGQFLWQKYR